MEALNNLFNEENDKKKGKKKVIYTKKLKFNPTGFPGAANFFLMVVFLGIGAALIFASTIFPQVNRSGALDSVVQSTASFQLSDDVNSGLFAYTNRKGDTVPVNPATYMGVSVLGDKIKNAEGVRAFLSDLQDKNFESNLENIYIAVGIMNKLGMLDSNEKATSFLVDKIYNQVLSLQEQDSGFKLTKFRSPTVLATYMALTTIERIGKLEDFKGKDQFSDAIKFVQLQQTASGGFGDISGQNATIYTTFHAVKVLLYDSKSEETTKQLAQVEGYVYECAAADGGFNEKEVEFFEDMYERESESSSTLEALYILFALAKEGIVDSSLLSEWAQVVSQGTSYVRACLRGGKGVRARYSSDSIDLRSNFRFYELATKFDRFNYGSINELANTAAGIGVLCIVFAIYKFYADQITDSKTQSTILSEIRSISIFATIAAVTLYFVPKFAILAYLLLFVEVGTKFYKYAGQDKTSGEMLFVAFGNAAFFVGLAVIYDYMSQGASLTSISMYFVMTGWFVATTFFCSYLAASITTFRRPSHYIGVGYTGWVCALVTFIIFISGKTTFQTALNCIFINGHFFNIFVVAPIVTLCASYGLSLIALAF